MGDLQNLTDDVLSASNRKLSVTSGIMCLAAGTPTYIINSSYRGNQKAGAEIVKPP
jgi:hypothetical protein